MAIGNLVVNISNPIMCTFHFMEAIWIICIPCKGCGVGGGCDSNRTSSYVLYLPDMQEECYVKIFQRC